MRATRSRSLRSPIPAVESQTHVADLHRRAAGERPVGDRDGVLAGLIAAQAGFEAHVEGCLPRAPGSPGDPADFLVLRREAGSDESGSGLPPAASALERSSGPSARASGAPWISAASTSASRARRRRRSAGRGRSRRSPAARSPRAPWLAGSARRSSARARSSRSPSGREQQARWPPSVRALERPQRRLEHPSVSWRGITPDVEEQQPVEPGRDRVAVCVAGQRRDPGVLAGRKAGRLGAERDEGHRLWRCCSTRARHRYRSRHRRRRRRLLRGRSAAVSASVGSVPVGGITHVIGFQWNVKLTRWGFSQTFCVLDVPGGHRRADEQAQLVGACARERRRCCRSAAPCTPRSSATGARRRRSCPPG